jgi:hypothetical protein
MGERKMAKKWFLGTLVTALAFTLMFGGCAFLSNLDSGGAASGTRTSQPSARQIFDSWVGSHYSELGNNISGRVSYNGNSITYDSSWTEDERVWKSSAYNGATGEGFGDYGMVPTGRKITHEKWVTFYFNKDGIITTWRSYGW